MQTIPKRPAGLVHPAVEDMYVKSSISAQRQEEQVLVIIAKSANGEVIPTWSDLAVIEREVEKQLGTIDRVDITVH
jgi:hypothetical protein